jgi:hypothetical protein
MLYVCSATIPTRERRIRFAATTPSSIAFSSCSSTAQRVASATSRFRSAGVRSIALRSE